MPLLTVRHRTTYAYREKVKLAPHRLMLRPREGRELKLLTHDLSIAPDAEIIWSTDVLGNAVATATFETLSNRLTIESVAEVEVTAPPWPIYNMASGSASYPFRYSAEEWTDLGALAAPAYVDRAGRLQAWAQGFVAGPSTDTLSLLQDLNAGVFSGISYQSREDEGTQAPLETLDRTWGSCRDLAVLFIEAARCLGFGARLVSGYMWNGERSIGSADRGSTHAWAEVYLPGAGWVPFDPTNCKMGGQNLIPVATGRNIGQIMPVMGSFVGASDAFFSMQVDVDVISGSALGGEGIQSSPPVYARPGQESQF
jgi:transglutaminase-like putative cysteine protease